MPVARFEFHADAGHGWLAVPMRLIRSLGIESLISSYSYLSRDGNIAYLEEDQDAGIFLRTLKDHGEPEPAFLYINDGSYSFIRELYPMNRFA